MQSAELLAKVAKIEIRTRKMVQELTAGAYHSHFKGRGIEFSEVREYSPGDDVRDIDWNVTARMGIPYLKKYSEERELTVILAVDVSSSTLFGSSSLDKQQQIAECAALIAFSAIGNNDKVGLLLFSDKTELYLPPRSGRQHILRLVRELVAFEGEERRSTNIGKALEELSRARKKRCVVFLISDFWDEGDFSKSFKLMAKHHDLIAVRVLDPREKALPGFSGELILEDGEDGSFFRFYSSGKNAAFFREKAGEALEKTNELCRKAKVDLLDITVGEDLARKLSTFFMGRRRNR